VLEVRRRNEDMEHQSMELDEVEHKLGIERQLLSNFRKENALLRQKLERITGERYLTENLTVLDRSAGLAYRAASEPELERLLEEKLDIIYNQEDEMERLAQQID
jgi:hypothetical protein